MVNLPAMQESQETQFRSLGQKNLLEEGMGTHFRILAWRTPWTKEPSELQSTAPQRGGQDSINIAHMYACTHNPVSILIEVFSEFN